MTIRFKAALALITVFSIFVSPYLTWPQFGFAKASCEKSIEEIIVPKEVFTETVPLHKTIKEFSQKPEIMFFLPENSEQFSRIFSKFSDKPEKPSRADMDEIRNMHQKIATMFADSKHSLAGRAQLLDQIKNGNSRVILGINHNANGEFRFKDPNESPMKINEIEQVALEYKKYFIAISCDADKYTSVGVSRKISLDEALRIAKYLDHHISSMNPQTLNINDLKKIMTQAESSLHVKFIMDISEKTLRGELGGLIQIVGITLVGTVMQNNKSDNKDNPITNK